MQKKNYKLLQPFLFSLLQPQFYVKFTNEISKNGDTVTFRLKVKKLGGVLASQNENGNESAASIIEREYDDFEFLNHTLTTQVKQAMITLQGIADS